MILRRFMKHVTDQNWFAVGLDVIVVIVGIFLGLQVQAYYEERAERVEEQKFLTRLHMEVMQSLNFTEENFDALILMNEFQETERLTFQVSNQFDGADTQVDLDHTHCLAILSSHIYIDQINSLPTITELLASGQMSIIQNEDIKIAVSQHSMALEGLKGLTDNLGSQALDLSRKYPSLITLDYRMQNIRNTDEFEHQCNYQEMAKSINFKNDLINNRAKLHAFNLTLAQQNEMLINLHEAIDAELGIIHGGEAQ